MKKRVHFLCLLILYCIGTSVSYATASFNSFNATTCNISIDAGDGYLTIHGLDAPIEIVKVFDANWQTVYECTATCSNPLNIPNLPAGIYYIRANKYTANWEPICFSEIITATVNSPTTSVDYCGGVRVVGGAEQITVTGVNAPWQKIEIYGPSTGGALRTICNDNCTDPQVISGLAAGEYVVRIEQTGNNNSTANSCTREIVAIVTSPSSAIDYCAGVSVIGGAEQITVTGVNAPWQKIEIFGPSTGGVLRTICNDNCTDPQVISGLAAGEYVVRIEQTGNNNSTANSCSREIVAIVTSPSTTIDYCADVNIQGGVGTISVSGINAPWNRVYYRTDAAADYIEICNDCANPLNLSNTSPGTYIIKVEQSDSDGSNFCSVEIAAVVTPINYCEEVQVIGGGTINITGINAPWNRVFYKLEGTADYTEVCNDCASPLSISNLVAGSYIVKVELSEGDGSNRCSVEMFAIVTGSARDYCADVSVLGGERTINIGGIAAPWNLVSYRLSGSSDYIEVCNDCANPLSISNLGAGNYIVKVQQSEGDGSNRCTVEIAAAVTDSARDFCAEVSVLGGEGTISVGGINAPWNRVSFRLASSATYTQVCSDCANPLLMNNLDAGTYVVKVEQSESDGSNACSIEIAANVTSRTINFCAGVLVSGEEGQIRITGITAPWQRIQYSGPNTNGAYVTVCNDNCGDPQIIPNLLAGTYTVRIEQSGNDNGAANFCTFDVLANVTEASANGNGNNGNANGNGNNGNANGNGNNGNANGNGNNGNANGNGNNGNANGNGNDNNNESREVCAERSATNTTSCDFGTYGAYLNTFNQEIGVFYDIVDGSFVEYTDGTARFKGTLVNKQDVWVRFEIDVTLSGRTTVAGEASPKEHTCGRPQDLSTFYYYPSFSGTITGTENATGALLTIQNNGPAFQVGNGANITEGRFPQPFGASGWFLLTVVNQPNDFTLNFPENPEAQVGDFNITLSGVAEACLDAESRSTEFTTFNAYSNQRKVDLEWLTNTTYKSDYYILERATNGEDFEALEMVNNRSKGFDIAYFKGLDQHPVLGDNFYRLKQVFKDGTSAYSRVRKVSFGVDLDAIATFPNPAQEVIYMDLSEFAGKKANILISNQFGGIVEDIKLDELPSDLVKIDLSKYSNGLYLIRTKIDRTRIITQKLIVSKMY